MSPLTKGQVKKVVKALAYSFASGFVATLALQSTNFLEAAQNGPGAAVALFTALVTASVVGGINAVAVAVLQSTKEGK